MFKQCVSAIVSIMCVATCQAEVFVKDVPNAVKAVEARKSGKSIYKCQLKKLSNKSGDPKNVKGSKVLFTTTTLKGLDHVDERFDNGERLYSCVAMEVNESTGKLVKGEQDDE